MKLYNGLILFVVTLLLFVSNLQAAQFLFTPTLTISEEYSDNVDLDYQNEHDDFITTVGLNLNGQVRWRTAGIELNYNPSYDTYADRSDYDSWRHSATLRVWKTVKQNTRYEFSNNYLYSNDPSDTLDTIDLDAITVDQLPTFIDDFNRRGRTKYYQNDAQVTMSHQFGQNDTFTLGYQYFILRDVDTPSGSTVGDHDTSTPSFSLTYDFVPRWGIQLDGSYSKSDYVDYNDRDEFNGGIQLLHHFTRTFSGFIGYNHTVLDYDQSTDEDYKIYRPSIGITMNLPQNAGFTIDAGYYIQDFEISEDQEGFNVDSTLFKRWTYRTGSIGVVGSSGYVIDDNGVEDNGFSIYYEARIDADYRFTSRLTSNTYCSYRYADYPNETPERVDQTSRIGTSLDYQALRWMAIRLSYDYSDVTSDDITNEYTENSFMITIRLAPSSAYRLN